MMMVMKTEMLMFY